MVKQNKQKDTKNNEIFIGNPSENADMSNDKGCNALA